MCTNNKVRQITLHVSSSTLYTRWNTEKGS